MKQTRLVQLPPQNDPAGLDRLILAVGKAAHDLVAAKAAKMGVALNVWDGENGLQGVIQDVIREKRIPNKRLPDLVSPRSIAENIGVLKPKPKKRRIAR